MFIHCTGKIAAQPFVLPIGNQKVYSIEELCYIAYNNVYILTPEFFSTELNAWLRDETDNQVIADKLDELINKQASLKDMVISLLCGCDYYKEKEIRRIIRSIDSMGTLPLHQKAKIKADQDLQYGNYGKAAKAYNVLLQGDMAADFSAKEFGDIMHNLGVAHFHIDSFAEARHDFLEAYSRNNNKNSLTMYLYTFLIEGKESEFVREAGVRGLMPQDIRLLTQTFETEDRKVRADLAYQNAIDKKINEETMEQYRNSLREAF